VAVKGAFPDLLYDFRIADRLKRIENDLDQRHKLGNIHGKVGLPLEHGINFSLPQGEQYLGVFVSPIHAHSSNPAIPFASLWWRPGRRISLDQTVLATPSTTYVPHASG